MFSEGFEKTGAVGPGRAIGATAGAATRAAKAVGGGVKKYVAGEKVKSIGSYRSALGKEKPVGKGLKATPEKVLERKSKMEASAKANKPSFARRHPFLTAGGLYLGARAAFGGGEDKQQMPPQQPQVGYGQY